MEETELTVTIEPERLDAARLGYDRAASWRRLLMAHQNVCVDCGVIFHGKGLFCSRCLTVQRDEACRRRAREQRYFRCMMPHKGG